MSLAWRVEGVVTIVAAIKSSDGPSEQGSFDIGENQRVLDDPEGDQGSLQSVAA